MVLFDYFNREPYCSITNGTMDEVTLLKGFEKLSVAKHPALPYSQTPEKKAYTESKIMGEQMATEIVKSTSKSIICVRIGSVNINNQPEADAVRVVWLSYRDLCSFIDRALEAPLNISGTYVAISNNYRSCIDLEDARRDLGYIPQDGAEKP